MKKVYTIPKSEIEQPIEAVAKIVDGKIVVEIETDDSNLPKLGDFLTSSEGKTFICNGKRNENNMVGSIAGQISDKAINVNPVSDWCKIEDCHYSDKTEIDNFLKLLEKTCYKKWDFENKKLVNTFIPKDGDYVKFGNNFVHYAIYNSPSKVYKNAFKAYAFYNSFELKFNTCDLCSDNIRPMTLNERRNFNMILKSNSKKMEF